MANINVWTPSPQLHVLVSLPHKPPDNRLIIHMQGTAPAEEPWLMGRFLQFILRLLDGGYQVTFDFAQYTFSSGSIQQSVCGMLQHLPGQPTVDIINIDNYAIRIGLGLDSRNDRSTPDVQ